MERHTSRRKPISGSHAPIRVVIHWQRLVVRGKTCRRCSGTGREVEKAAALLKDSLAPLGVKVTLTKASLPLSRFRKAPLASNAIRINGKTLEEWLGASTGKSTCCDVCGPVSCRTVVAGGVSYETVPARLVVAAGLMAAAAAVSGVIHGVCCLSNADCSCGCQG